MNINKANKSKNIRQNIEFNFHHQKSFQKENMFKPCDVICHVTVAFYIYHTYDTSKIRIDVSYNNYALNNSQKYQKS
jgi:hypothetical protein